MSKSAGETLLFVEGNSSALQISLRGWEERGVTEPSAQTVIRGSKEGFSETLRTNTALVRRRIKSEKLWLETFHVGRVTQTDVSIMYIQGIVTPSLVEEIRTRIQRINIDAILESGYIFVGSFNVFPCFGSYLNQG